MSTRDFFIKRWEQELPAFGKVLRAVPDSHHSYRPHERSTAAGALAWQLADEQQQICDMIDTGAAHLGATTAPSKTTDIVKAWDKATEDLRKRFRSLDDKKWSSPAKLMMGDKVLWTDTLEAMLWGYLFDMVHHRGQLSAYLRPMGAKVPAIYGPSADDMGS
ncbi:MAG TPA: DinB family protein [Thermoanaerobaculia bacterium]|nr:DinB family protein [Thermoanaerobaculia bacterium]